MTLEICSVCGDHTVGPLWSRDESECRERLKNRDKLIQLLARNPTPKRCRFYINEHHMGVCKIHGLPWGGLCKDGNKW